MIYKNILTENKITIPCHFYLECSMCMLLGSRCQIKFSMFLAWNNLSQDSIHYLYVWTRVRIQTCVNTKEDVGSSVKLIHPLFLNLCTYWSVNMIIYCNPAILPLHLILSKLKHIWNVAILFSINLGVYNL